MVKAAGGLRPLGGYFKKLRAVLGVLLGLFILAQMMFLPVANLLGFLPTLRDNLRNTGWAQALAPDWLDKKGRGEEILAKANDISQRWQEMTGQPENWSLFAPDVADDIWFVRVEMNWQDGDSSAPEAQIQSISFISDNEPPDPNHFFRLGHFRIRRYEMAVEVHLFKEEDKTPEERAADWRDKIREKVRKDWDNIQAYLRYRLQ